MITKLEGRDKVQPHLISNKLNEVIDFLNEQEIKQEEAKTNDNANKL